MDPDPIKTFYNIQHTECVGLNTLDGGTKFKTFISLFPAPDSRDCNNLTGGRIRMRRFIELKTRYPISSDGYSCLKLSALHSGVWTNYAFLYWPRGSDSIIPEYICISPTYDSKDGEYRSRFISGATFHSTYERAIDILAPYEDIVIAMTMNHTLILEPTIYSVDDEDYIQRIVRDTRIAIMAFTVALFIDIPDVNRGKLMLHTNATYINILQSIIKSYPLILDIKNFNKENQDIISTFKRGVPVRYTAQCGQKIIPMITKETMNAFDYNFPAWKELLITAHVSDIVINFISPSFALYNNWTYIENTDRKMFENKSMHTKYKRAKIASKIVNYIRESRTMLNTTDDIKNSRTQSLSSKLFADLDYSRSFLTMSPMCMMYTSEDVGCTAGSYLTFLRSLPVDTPNVLVNIFSTKDRVARIVFELAYGVHALHSKAGIIHADLHINNMTQHDWASTADIKRMPDGKISVTPFYPDPVIAYVAGERGEADTYIFPATGQYSTIIDYSRAIIGPSFRYKLEENKSERYADNFYTDQVSKVMKTFYRYIPTLFEKHRAVLRATIVNNFEIAFRILSCVDYIGIGSAIASRYERLLSAPVPPEAVRSDIVACPDIITIARKLETVGRETMVVMLQDLATACELGGGNGSGELKVPDFPGSKILHRVFGEWSFPKWSAREPERVKSVQLVDAYNINNKMQYSTIRYETFPPWARMEEIEKHLGNLKMTDLFPYGIEKFLRHIRPSSRVEGIAENQRSEQERLDGPYIEATSSWAE